MTLTDYIERRDRRRQDFKKPRLTVINRSNPCQCCGKTSGDGYWLAGEKWCENCWKRQRNEHLGLIPHGNTGGRDLTYKDDGMSPWQENAFRAYEQ